MAHMRWSARVWVASLGTAVLVLGMSAAWSAPASPSRLYARDAGSVCDEGWLDPAAGSDEGACYFLAQPVSDASAAAGQPLEHQFTYGKRVTRFAPYGRVQVHLTVGHVENTVGAGATIVKVTLLGQPPHGSTATLGKASATGLVSPTGTDEFDLSVPVTQGSWGKPLDRLALRVEIDGVAAPHAYVRVNGRTWLDYAARR